jgi:cobyrinic acid a,c-diamide synthase
LADAFVVAAPASGSGKTVITLALLRAFRDAGLKVGSAKIGPDYIDPRFHEAATGRPCVNIDSWAMRPQMVGSLLQEAASDVDLVILEGVMGLFDGAEDGRGSTADVCEDFKLPAVLVVDATRQSQSIAALVHGFATFRKRLKFGGVIVNGVASARHAEILRKAVPSDLLLGLVPRITGLELPSRHLGLVQATEHDSLDSFIARASEVVARSVDLDRLREIAGTVRQAKTKTLPLRPLGQVVAVANDAAFGFSYQHILAGWAAQGAEIRFFSPLADQAPARDVDAIFLPGGYPELHAGVLSGNSTFLDGLLQAAAGGKMIYGECGGFMVLGRLLVDAKGKAHPMAALLPHSTTFATRKLSLGYRQLRHQSALPFPRRLRGHEFHYSSLAEPVSGEPLFEMTDSLGTELASTGLQIGRIMGSYAHVIDSGEAA